MRTIKQLKGIMAITPPIIADRVIWLGMIEAAIRGGVDMVQLRLKPATPMDMLLQARRVLTLTRHHGIPLIINDYPEVAWEVGAQGVHLGKDDPSVSEVRRRYGNKLIIGATTYCDPELAMDLYKEGADYVGISSPFTSQTKKNVPDCPLEISIRLKKNLPIPVFLVGGINLKSVNRVKATGVDGIAVSWGLFGTGDPLDMAKAFRKAWYQN